MALISCSNCSELISDKASRCVFCGYVLRESAYNCPDCGAIIAKGEKSCPSCGCPIDECKYDSIKTVKSSKKSLVVALVFLFVVLVCSILLREAYDIAASDEYSVKYATLLNLMIDGVQNAETAGNLAVNVWNNSIYERNSAETDKYTRREKGTGEFYSDFNDALNNLFCDTSYLQITDYVQENRSAALTQMRDMGNPPKEWEKVYDELRNLYEEYLDFTGLAISPTGSLNTFSDKYNESKTKFLKSYEKMLLYVK